ncbi:MAG TPA: glycosyltransferase [Gemmatimonadota bacterium]|nr:glycosyltransferase [Gemmatimonadota bacterium]
MRILLVHNYYRQPGGEDVVLRAERDLLRDAGHEVLLYERHNSEIDDSSVVDRLRLLRRTTWADDSYRALQDIVRSKRPDVAHFHNTFPLVSPAGWYACKEQGVPVVQTLHNYRLLCLNAQFLRRGGVCESCLRRAPWPGVLHACYRGSRTQSLAVASMLMTHRRRDTYGQAVDTYIALTEFARRKFIEGGIPGELIRVKPNFVDPDPGARVGSGDYALFVGRLSEEKGIETLLAAWRQLEGIPLRIAGDGPLLDSARAMVDGWGRHDVELLGQQPATEIVRLLKSARFLVFPSVWYEGFPRTLAEAFACGVPVLASRLGGAAEIVAESVSGRFFRPGDPDDLARAASTLWQDPAECQRLGRGARESYETRYTPAANLEILTGIYEAARALSAVRGEA